ncbi:receptor protein kinase-like protein At4g34220 [Prosopis cineraria]|uniref:receptor protein kinase-like protein At4g34220 n=1 Tax=Prosopis cineraria TaxID=364024 RepID=UPI00240F8795|nr:receptor protein kinase-like protein At4g34220 [Prosopis cineraria]
MNLSSNILHRFWCKVSLFLFLLLPSSALNTDGVSLLSFKYSILSDPLSVLESWNYNDDNPCLWNGVTCDEIEDPGTMLRVTSLVLPNSQLLGSISEELGNIPYLRRLDLSRNLLNGSLPSSIFNSSELRVLSLASNVISGELPDLVGQLKNLQVLNVSDNAFAGSVPENLTALKNLTFVSLRSNYFSGQVPSGFNSVQVLDLSSNLLNGSLPNNIGGERLRYLSLSYNKISGIIPPKFATLIPENSTIDLAFNNLTGPIPESLVLLNQKTESFAGNSDLCGKPLENLCSIPSTLSIPPLNTTTTTSSAPAIAAIPKTIDTNPETNTTTNGSSNGLKPTTIVAIVLGDLVGVAIIATAIFFVYHQRITKGHAKAKENPCARVRSPPKLHFYCLRTKEDSASSETTGSDSDHESTTFDTTTSNLQKDVALVALDAETQLDLETLLQASAFMLGTTRRENRVYRAVLEDGRAFAVRRIGECGVERKKDFENHMKSIAKIRHPNLVKVRGFCWGEGEKLVICDYVPNGSLASSFSHRRAGCSSLNLTLDARLKIAKGIAQGLAFIHEKKYVHGNIKPSNILLNSAMEPIISDFGLDRLRPSGSISNRGSQPDLRYTGSSSGTHQILPYQAPESLQGVQVQPKPKWDVYSFGIVLLELLSGRVLSVRELDRWPKGGSDEEEKNRVLRMVDVGIRSEVERKEEAILLCFKLGFRCSSLRPQKRPSMKEAVQILEKILY